MSNKLDANSRPVTEVEMEEIVVPYARIRMNGSLRMLNIILPILIIILNVAVFFGDRKNFLILFVASWSGFIVLMLLMRLIVILGIRRISKMDLYI